MLNVVLIPKTFNLFTGGLVLVLEEEGFTNGEFLMEEESVLTLRGGLVSAMEEDDGLA